MRINVVGAGPAGLLFSLLIKRRFPAWQINVLEQNPPDATFGFGVVFSLNALAFLERDVADFYRQLAPRLESWPMQRIIHRDERVDIDGNGFSAIGRLELNQFLQQLCANAGVCIEFERNITSADDLADLQGADLLIGADGANSFVRRTLEAEFAPEFEWLTNRFAWYGTAQLFDCLSLTFRTNEHGCFVAHHYRHSRTMSTFIVECDETSWRRAGLDRMPDEESRVYCQSVFAPDLNGKPLVSNKSIWRQFLLLAAHRWFVGNTVLIGDALRTVHFSIGSGTRLAFEDAIALDRAFGEAGDDVPRALAAFERERRPVVEKIIAAANLSSYWYERLSEKMMLEPWQLAYDYMTRSGRMTDERLRELSPRFMARVDAEQKRVRSVGM
ncbi:MAG TPA: FAD-dependent monooxygenase [Candidatus Binatia bacterium]|jgi:2-polyprenyl-6-methoxyphenol hydroxylase-like FAD-dependent oxidoreductase